MKLEEILTKIRSKNPFDFGTDKQKALYKALIKYMTEKGEDCEFYDVAFYLGITVNFQFQDVVNADTLGELDFFENDDKAIFWSSHNWTLPDDMKKIIEEHGYTIETDFNKLTKEEKAQLMDV